jgi:transposase InsO family protein
LQVNYYTVFVIDIATRVVHIAGTTPKPNSDFMAQIARNLTDCVDGFLLGKRYLILDRDGKYSPAFKEIIKGAGVKIVLTSYQAPNMNVVAERFVQSVKSECLDCMIFVGERFENASVGCSSIITVSLRRTDSSKGRKNTGRNSVLGGRSRPSFRTPRGRVPGALARRHGVRCQRQGSAHQHG